MRPDITPPNAPIPARRASLSRFSVAGLDEAGHFIPPPTPKNSKKHPFLAHFDPFRRIFAIFGPFRPHFSPFPAPSYGRKIVRAVSPPRRRKNGSRTPFNPAAPAQVYSLKSVVSRLRGTAAPPPAAPSYGRKIFRPMSPPPTTAAGCQSTRPVRDATGGGAFRR